MCNVSMIAKDWTERMWQQYPQIFPFNQGLQPPVSREEFNTLKAELESIKKLLVAAKQYDTETNQPDCEDAEKIALFRQLAKALGVDINDVFPAHVTR